MDRLAADPTRHIRAIREDRRRERRALTVEELRRLLFQTAREPRRYKLTGAERALLYRLAVESGFRRGELASLTRASFALDGPSPTVTVLASSSKRRREDILPLRPDTAEALRAHLVGKEASAPAFAVPSRNYAAKMLRCDAEAAGVDTAGLDFHSLRHTTATLLCKAGVHPRAAQAILRHSDVNLTLGRYTHLLVEDEAAALDRLPDLGEPPEAEAVRATGTEGTSAPGSIAYQRNSICVRPCAREGGFEQTPADPCGRKVQGNVSGRWESNPHGQLGRLRTPRRNC